EKSRPMSTMLDVLSTELVGGPDRCAGRVEVTYFANWRKVVCSEGWDLRDAEVVCQQLGCGYALAALGDGRFGEGQSGPLMTKVECSGDEYDLVFGCQHEYRPATCGKYKDAAVICSDIWPRLSDGVNRCAGRLEIYYFGGWTGVCSEQFGLRDAQVVCRELHCGRALAAVERYSSEYYPYLSNVDCSGDEEHFWQCSFQEGGCINNGHAGVICEDSGLSLSTTTTTTPEMFLPFFVALLVASVCGDHLYGPSGKFTSPNYPQLYPNNAKCVWEIHAEHASYINLIFDNLKSDAMTMDVQPILLCGGQQQQQQQQQRQSGCDACGHLCLFDPTVLYFSGSYSCGGYLTSSSGSFHSPFYPANYPNNADCTWRIQRSVGYQINLTFTSMTTECCCDYVEIYEEDFNRTTFLGRYCSGSSRTFISSSNILRVRFHSDISVTYQGFYATYSSYSPFGEYMCIYFNFQY
ncbi:hypothetical protein lerEdw1_013749, partial [Lerista edwardsae]